MGIMAFLKFASVCIDFVAWPLIALCYPLYASIRAVETGSKYHTRKLVIYWTLFSFFSLFEFAFMKIIEWIPFWSSIRFIAIILLVMPQFDGACDAYESLVRPVLSVNLQSVIEKFYKRKKDKPHKREAFLDLVDKYIKENGSEALEMLIANKVQSPESVATAWVTKGTGAAAKVKDMIPPEGSAQNRRPETPPLKKAQQEWTCDLCNVITTSEKDLNAHRRGSKHKSKCESLKASKLHANDTGPSPLATGPMNNTVKDLLCLRDLGISGVPRKPAHTIYVKWQPPLPGWIKANTDGSSLGQPGDSSCGAVFRDFRGLVVGCFSQSLGKGFAFEAELVGAMMAIEIAYARGWHNLWLESDSLQVISLLNTKSDLVPSNHRSRWRLVLSLVEKISFTASHIYREGNMVADALSQPKFDVCWWDFAPPHIEHLVLHDLSSAYNCRLVSS